MWSTVLCLLETETVSLRIGGKTRSIFESVLLRSSSNAGSHYSQHSSAAQITNHPLYRRQYQHFQLIKFPNSTNVRCNDGSTPGYYIRPSKNECSKKWLIFLEGGWYCFNNSTCDSRRRTHYDLFSSEFWSEIRQRLELNCKELYRFQTVNDHDLTKEKRVTGILSNDKGINPSFYDYNAVYIPYCSSDLWSGKRWQKTNGLYFHGSRILDTLIDDLVKNEDFKQVEEIAFVGSSDNFHIGNLNSLLPISAGGIGLMLNIDRLARRIGRWLRRTVPVSGIVDSAWFLDYPAFKNSNCTHIYDCPPDTAIRKGMRLWSPRIPRRCRRYQGRGFDWKCFMGPVIYRHLKNPVFIIQSLFDDAQLQMSKVPILEGGSNTKFAYIQQLGGFAAQTLRQAKGVFAHSCVDHEILTKNNWASVTVNNQNLGKTLSYWRVFLDNKFRKKLKRKLRLRKKKQVNRKKNRNLRKNSNKKCKRSLNHRFPDGPDPTSSQLKVIDSCHIKQVTSGHSSEVGPLNRTLTRCADAIPLIPFCNPTCTPLSHPVFGYKMSFVDLLELYNVRIDLIAKSLGIGMDKLRKLNTQQQIKLLYCSSK